MCMKAIQMRIPSMSLGTLGSLTARKYYLKIFRTRSSLIRSLKKIEWKKSNISSDQLIETETGMWPEMNWTIYSRKYTQSYAKKTSWDLSSLFAQFQTKFWLTTEGLKALLTIWYFQYQNQNIPQKTKVSSLQVKLLQKVEFLQVQ